MRPHDFWRLADRLLAKEKNPEGFRSAVSRAYYAAFLTAEEFLAAMGVSLLNKAWRPFRTSHHPRQHRRPGA